MVRYKFHRDKTFFPVENIAAPATVRARWKPKRAIWVSFVTKAVDKGTTKRVRHARVESVLFEKCCQQINCSRESRAKLIRVTRVGKNRSLLDPRFCLASPTTTFGNQRRKKQTDEKMADAAICRAVAWFSTSRGFRFKHVVQDISPTRWVKVAKSGDPIFVRTNASALSATFRNCRGLDSCSPARREVLGALIHAITELYRLNQSRLLFASSLSLSLSLLFSFSLYLSRRCNHSTMVQEKRKPRKRNFFTPPELHSGESRTVRDKSSRDLRPDKNVNVCREIISLRLVTLHLPLE